MTSIPMKQDADALMRNIEAAERTGDAAQRLAAYQSYLQAVPEAAWAWLNAGDAAQKLGERRMAETCYRRALSTPGFDQPQMAYNNLAGLYLSEGNVPAALQYGREAVRLAPGYATGWWCLGIVLMHAGEFREGLAAFESAAGNGADIPPAVILDARRRVCRWDGIKALENVVREQALARPGQTDPWLLFTLLPSDAMEQRRYAEAYSQATYGAVVAHSRRRRDTADGKVRLGYLSSDFHDHATTRLLTETIERHDRARFEVIGFDIGSPGEDAAGLRIRRAFDACHDLHACSDEAACAFIAECAIDILIDLKGYTTGARPGILARRAAPVQVSYLGWPGTLGATFMDYVIADPVVAPEPAAFSERVLYLDCYQPTCRRRDVADTPSRQALGLPAHAVVLGSMNFPWKLTPAWFDLWAEILHRATDAVLWQLVDSECADGLRREASRRGIERQLIFAPRLGQEEHLARLAHIDLALDTAPCGGHTTTSDLLWAGVPVLTLLGESFSGRVAASLVTAVGMPGLVARDPAHYKSMALALIEDRARLAAMKSELLRAGRASLLFDNARYTASLERALLSTLESAASDR